MKAKAAAKAKHSAKGNRKTGCPLSLALERELRDAYACRYMRPLTLGWSSIPRPLVPGVKLKHEGEARETAPFEAAVFAPLPEAGAFAALLKQAHSPTFSKPMRLWPPRSKNYPLPLPARHENPQRFAPLRHCLFQIFNVHRHLRPFLTKRWGYIQIHAVHRHFSSAKFLQPGKTLSGRSQSTEKCLWAKNIWRNEPPKRPPPTKPTLLEL